MTWKFSEVDIPYPREDWAQFVMVTLKTDKELSDSMIRTLEVAGCVLKVCVLLSLASLALFLAPKPMSDPFLPLT